MPSYHLCARVNWWIYNCERNGDAVCTYAENFEDMEVGVLNFRLSGSFSNEGQSSLLYSRHITMMPEVGMVITYPKCFEAGMNVDVLLQCHEIYTLPCSLSFLLVNFQCNCNYMCFQRHSAPFLHLYFFCGNAITPLVPQSYTFLWSPSRMWNEQMYKHDSFWCDGGSCYGVKLNGYIIEQSHSKGKLQRAVFTSSVLGLTKMSKVQISHYQATKVNSHHCLHAAIMCQI